MIETARGGTILIVHNNLVLASRLGRAFEARGFSTCIASDTGLALAVAGRSPPAFAVVDLQLHDGRSIEMLRALRALNPEVRIVGLQGFLQPRSAEVTEGLNGLSVLAMASDADEILQRLSLAEQPSGH
jgi:two-component system response regulator RegA